MIGRLEIANVLEAVMDWIGPSSNGLQSGKIYLIHLHGAYGFYISRLVSTLSIPVYFNTGKKMLDIKNTDACRRHAMD